MSQVPMSTDKITPARLAELRRDAEREEAEHRHGPNPGSIKHRVVIEKLAAFRELESARTTLEGVRAYFAALDAPIDQGSFNAVLQKQLAVMEAESKLRAMLATEKEPAQEKQT